MTINYNTLVRIEDDTERVGSYHATMYQFPFPESSNEDIVQQVRDKKMDSMFTKYPYRPR